MFYYKTFIKRKDITLAALRYKMQTILEVNILTSPWSTLFICPTTWSAESTIEE